LPWMMSSTSADFRRAVQRLISSSITKLICVSLKRLHLSRKSLGHYTLKQAEKSPLLSERTHPDHPLYTQAVGKLEQLGPQAFADRRQVENAAGSLAFEAKVGGMQRIDVVIQSRDGTGLFAVQGNPNDPGCKRIYADKSAAAERSLEQSSSALRQDMQVDAQDQQEQKRTQAQAR
ncbi:MAG TPA: XVIPCD domain-containing protein, partial [Pseudoxanthomonas sp.]|nr:XVIPCD domain-containing protein [Pseudoxanthomonas sp.]